jgi:hypothetical protein
MPKELLQIPGVGKSIMLDLEELGQKIWEK